MKIQLATLLAVACTLTASGVAVADNLWAQYCAQGAKPPANTAYACFAGRNRLIRKSGGLLSSSHFKGRFSPDLRGLVLFDGGYTNNVNFASVKITTIAADNHCMAVNIQDNNGRSIRNQIVCPGGQTIWIPGL